MLGIGVITRNRSANVARTVAAIYRHTQQPFTLCIGDQSDNDLTRIALDGEHVVRSSQPGIPANRNRVLAELDRCHAVLMLEDDYTPIGDGWDRAYTNRLADHPLLLGLHPFCGDPLAGQDGVVWRPNMSGHLFALRQDVWRTIGAWDQVTFADRYGLDDGEYVNRARRHGLLGTQLGFPTLADADRWCAHQDEAEVPSSDGKSFGERMADHAVNLAAYPWANGYVPNPEAAVRA